MKMFSTIWQSVTHSDEIDKQLRPYLIEQIKKYISRDDPADLYKNFTEVPDYIRDMVSKPFRERVLQLLTNSRRDVWDNSRFESIFNLLNSERLRWTKDEQILVLERVSNLEDDRLLIVFPLLLKDWIDQYKDIKNNKIDQICVRWYENLMFRMAYISTACDGEYLTAIFEKLSTICSVVNEQTISDRLMGITFDYIKNSPENLIFNATIKVAKLDSIVIHVFTKVIKRKIDSMVLDHDEILLKKMQVICGCTGNNLKIPNE